MCCTTHQVGKFDKLQRLLFNMKHLQKQSRFLIGPSNRVIHHQRTFRSYAWVVVCVIALLGLLNWCLTSGGVEVDSDGNALLNNPDVAMDDPELLQEIRKLLVPPSLGHYNFTDPTLTRQGVNPSAGQTQAVADILKGFGGDGFFVECGANDGEWHSNTIWLERTLGWKGLMIEADPIVFEKLQGKHRNAWMGHFCLSNKPYPSVMPFYIDTYLSSLGSGLIKSKRYFAEKYVKVQCLPLYSVLLAINRTTVDFFSLDVEGSELDILYTVPFDKVIFKVITIEHVVLKEGKVGLRKFMESKGYIFYRTVVDKDFAAGDSIFIHKSVELTEEQRAKIGIEDSIALRPPRTG